MQYNFIFDLDSEALNEKVNLRHYTRDTSKCLKI